MRPIFSVGRGSNCRTNCKRINKKKNEKSNPKINNSHSPLSSAVWTGLEPATPCVTGRYSNQLNYHTVWNDI